MNAEQIRKVNASSRSGGAIGKDPLCYRVLRRLLQGQDNYALGPRAPFILDYGAGKDCPHTRKLREQGYAVKAWDIGTNYPTGRVNESSNRLWAPKGLVFEPHSFLNEQILLGQCGRELKTFTHIVASNVLNVQPALGPLETTIRELYRILAAHSGLRLLCNYPNEPRYSIAGLKDVERRLESNFPRVFRIRVGSSFVWSCSLQ